MLTRVQVLIPNDLLQAARLAAASHDLSFSKFVTKSLEEKVQPEKKESVYIAFKKLAKIIGKKKVKLPPDFATNDDYLYRLP
ncbi:hypothetical protein HY409_02270 [Candidatus Gottesmanbacteria bacterium]|nr:hypothetical protein [Candidatus Gottesmanbacteria bacterium]